MQVRMAIAEVPGALHPHDLRVRKIGRAVAVDAHVEVDRTLDVTTAHAIAANVRARIVAQLGGDTVATIHVDPQPTG
jgi:divalent metal cation (Fe/Co/Zn/Cd) transporter